jgi:hypothetical protein
MHKSSEQELLTTLAGFDQSDGASLALVAWRLSREVSTIEPDWEQIHASGLIRPVGADPVSGVAMYRLTAGGWAALHAPVARTRPIGTGLFIASTRTRASVPSAKAQRRAGGVAQAEGFLTER